jgi:hypothetical protein
METGIFLFASVFASKEHAFASGGCVADPPEDDSRMDDSRETGSPEDCALKSPDDRPSDDRLFGPHADPGDPHAPIFRFRTCSSNVQIARARIFPTSPSGTEWRSRERSSWSSAWTLSSAVKRTTYLSAPSASVVPVSRRSTGADDADVAEDTEEVDGTDEVEDATKAGR